MSNRVGSFSRETLFLKVHHPSIHPAAISLRGSGSSRWTAFNPTCRAHLTSRISITCHFGAAELEKLTPAGWK